MHQILHKTRGRRTPVYLSRNFLHEQTKHKVIVWEALAAEK
jgi:hypothetical protein